MARADRCKQVRAQAYRYAMQALKVFPEDTRKLIAGLLATSTCRGLRGLKEYIEWHRLKWRIEREGEDPAEVYRKIEEMICGCERGPLLFALEAITAFLLGVLAGYVLHAILG